MIHEQRATLRKLHRKGVYTFWQALGVITLFLVLAGLTVACWYSPYWLLVVLCWAVQAHVGHANLLAFHEASHFLLHPRRKINEAIGLFMGSCILTPLSVYRHVHNLHHLHLGTERDVELWPFVKPTVPRALRLLAAIGELGLGFFYTPVVFLHGVWSSPPRAASAMQRIKREYLLCAVGQGVLLSLLTWFGLWEAFVIGYLVPAMIAGNLQSLRKFTEHMGMLGNDVPTLTRTVVASDWLGRALSHSMLHIDLHGIHHRYAKIPHYRLNQAVPHVYDSRERATAIKSNYLKAIAEMLGTLGDPRVGKQWLKSEKAAEQKAA